MFVFLWIVAGIVGSALYFLDLYLQWAYALFSKEKRKNIHGFWDNTTVANLGYGIFSITFGPVGAIIHFFWVLMTLSERTTFFKTKIKDILPKND